MGLISLIYVSIETRPMTPQDITAILEKAREFNAKENITGMLLYRNGYFIQALEGEEDRVRALYDKIKRDERHANVLMIYDKPIQERSFGNWSMGFRDLDGLDPSTLEGYTDFLNEPMNPNLVGNSSRAKSFLELFREQATY